MPSSPCWIEAPEVAALAPEEQAAFRGLTREDGTLHNLYRAFALWPRPVAASDQLYRDLVHAPDGPLDLAHREFVATQVALITGCAYAAAHHGANFKAFWGDAAEGQALLDGLAEGRYDGPLFDRRRRAMARYGAKLTRDPASMAEADIEDLRAAGLSDAEILHLNQIAANFNYWVRTINGLGITLGDERIGLDDSARARLTAAQPPRRRD